MDSLQFLRSEVACQGEVDEIIVEGDFTKGIRMEEIEDVCRSRSRGAGSGNMISFYPFWGFQKIMKNSRVGLRVVECKKGAENKYGN